MDSQWNHLPSVIIFQIFAYLSPQDRLLASSSCRAWRECLYHPYLWPTTRILLDIQASRRRLRRSRRKKKATLNGFVEKCSRFLQHVVISFDPSDYSDLVQLSHILNLLNKPKEDSYGSAYTLKSLSLKPSPKTIKNPLHDEAQKVLVSITDSIENIITDSKGLEHLGLGCWEQLLNSLTPSLINLFKQNDSLFTTIQSLHLASIKDDPDYYPVLDFTPRLLEPFNNLKIISLDFDYICDELLLSLAGKENLAKLIINVHGIDEHHPGIQKSSWTNLRKANPKLEVSINLLHTDDFHGANLRDMIFDTDVLLTDFKAYFIGIADENGDSLIDLVNTVSARHSETLRSFVLVDYLKHTSSPNVSFSRSGENPLVILAWRCRNLENFTVLGFEMSEADLTAITRLRGSFLKEFKFPTCCISLVQSPGLEDEGYYEHDKFYLDMAPSSVRKKIIESIAEPLNRTWSPISVDKLPKTLFEDQYSPSTTYLREILSEQVW